MKSFLSVRFIAKRFRILSILFLTTVGAFAILEAPTAIATLSASKPQTFQNRVQRQSHSVSVSAPVVRPRVTDPVPEPTSTPPVATPIPATSTPSSDSSEDDEHECPLPSKPEWWVRSSEGGTRTFGPIRALLPSGFTHQGGASVFGDIVTAPQGLLLPNNHVADTIFAFGIWPTQDQKHFQKPIEFRFTLDAKTQASGVAQGLTFKMYDPESQSWFSIPSRFQSGTRQLVTSVQAFRPVSKQFPTWGGRTFLGVFYSSAGNRMLFNRNMSQESVQVATQTTSVTAIVTAQHLNVRTGPGAQYARITTIDRGQRYNVIGRNRTGSWVLLQIPHLRSPSEGWVSSRFVRFQGS